MHYRAYFSNALRLLLQDLSFLVLHRSDTTCILHSESLDATIELIFTAQRGVHWGGDENAEDAPPLSVLDLDTTPNSGKHDSSSAFYVVRGTTSDKNVEKGCMFLFLISDYDENDDDSPGVATVIFFCLSKFIQGAK